MSVCAQGRERWWWTASESKRGGCGTCGALLYGVQATSLTVTAPTTRPHLTL